MKVRGPSHTRFSQHHYQLEIEYYADTPITPQEAEEEREEVYSSDVPFVQRIEECLHRYRNKRRIQTKNAQYFSEFLFLGGIDCQPRQFQGGVESEGTIASEFKAATGLETVHHGGGGSAYYNNTLKDAGHWDVDFTGVLAGYLSISVPRMTWGNERDVKEAIGVVRNFYNYVLMHDVCPEYKDDIRRALRLCDTGEEEIKLVYLARQRLPGQFSLACQELFLPKAEQTPHENNWVRFVRPKKFDPKTFFCAVLAFLQPELAKKSQDIEKRHLVNEMDVDLEIVSIHRPGASNSNIFRRLPSESGEQVYHPVGTMECKYIRLQDGYDLRDCDLAQPLGDQDTFFLDDIILEKLKVGMKLRVTVCELDSGVKFFKNAPSIYPTFYTFLPQELMRHYKEPVENPRPAPSANSYFGEGDIFDDEIVEGEQDVGDKEEVEDQG